MHTYIFDYFVSLAQFIFFTYLHASTCTSDYFNHLLSILSTQRLKVPSRPLAANELRIRIRDMNGEEHHFIIKQTTRMVKVFKAYAKLRGVSRTTFRFLLDGDKIIGDETAPMLELEDGDCLDVLLDQVGC